MKLFKFPLESLRTLRRQKERLAQQNYARALAACQTAAERVQEAEHAVTAAWKILMAELRHGAEAATIQGRRAWCLALETRRNQCQAACEEARRAADSARREMVSAAREREALDHFCDKSRRAYDHEVQREEQKIFDELAVQRCGPDLLPTTARPRILNSP